MVSTLVGLVADVKLFDPLQNTVVIEYGGNKYTIYITGSKYDLFTGANKEKVGVIRVGSPNSGAIWFKDDCIGEYVVNDNGKYTITPIKEGFKSSDTIISTSPFKYLLEKIVA
jgi:hypothetical protein